MGVAVTAERKAVLGFRNLRIFSIFAHNSVMGSIQDCRRSCARFHTRCAHSGINSVGVDKESAAVAAGEWENEATGT